MGSVQYGRPRLKKQTDGGIMSDTKENGINEEHKIEKKLETNEEIDAEFDRVFDAGGSEHLLETRSPEQIQSDAANAILERGIPIEITVENPGPLHRLGILPKIRTFTIRPIKLGALLQIAKIINSMPKPDVSNSASISPVEAAVKHIITHQEPLISIAVFAIQNRESDPWYWPFSTFLLERYIRANLSANNLLTLFSIVTQQMGCTDFLASILSVGRLNVMTRKQTEGITSISGKQSEALSSTSDSIGTKSCGDEVGKT